MSETLHDGLKELLGALFGASWSIARAGTVFTGTGTLNGRAIALIGTVAGQIEVGVDEACALAGAVLDIIEADAQGAPRDILVVVDNSGQRLAKRDELLGNAGYLAHLSKVLHLARRRGHRVLALIHSLAVSGGFMATGMAATSCVALAGAEVRVMRLDAMSRITRIPLARLQELVKQSAVFGPGAANYYAIGALDGIWAAPSPDALEQAFDAMPEDGADLRSVKGAERGGRSMAHAVAERVRQA